MARFVVTFSTVAVTILSASCIKIVDVVQPLEVRTGSTFEVMLLVRADVSARADGPVFGILGVSLPEGVDVKEATFRGAAKGKLRRLDGVNAGPLGGRPGNEWTFFRTHDDYESSVLSGGVFDVKLKIKAGKEAGDYRFAYAAAVVPVGQGGDPDVSWLEWQKPPDGTAARWITVK